MKIKVEKPTDEQVAEMTRHPTWSAGESVFDWEYDSEETCYVLEGEVMVTTEGGEVVQFGVGDMVTFPKGLKCVWNVKKPIRKHYKFG